MNTRRKRTTFRVPSTPEIRPGFRDSDHTRSVVLSFGLEFIEALDDLCEVNQRSRREIVEILISEASVEFQQDASARIQPL
jgi:hypothetical protein